MTETYGGGIFVDRGESRSPNKTNLEIFDNVVISNNTAEWGGGIHANAQSGLLLRGNATVTKNNATYGGGISGSSIFGFRLQDNSSVSNNKATSGGGIYLNTSLTLQNNSSVSGNNATDGGGIYTTLKGNLALLDNSTVSKNKADYGGGICVTGGSLNLQNNSSVSKNKAAIDGGGIYSKAPLTLQDNSSISGNEAIFSGGGVYAAPSGNLALLSNSSISENTADYGGGIFLDRSPLSLQNNSSVSINTAYQGGGIFLYPGNGDPTISISGESDETISLVKNSAAEGGAVYIYVATNMSKYGLFKKTTSGSGLLFSDNVAAEGYFWNLTDPDEVLTDSMKFIKTLAGMENTEFSEPFSNAYNNYDINFAEGSAIAPVTVQYYADDLNSVALGTTSFNSYLGAELTASNIASNLGDDWLNLHQPSGYMAGQLQETLPMTVSGDTILKVLYLPEETGGSSGGSSTGSAGVSNPTATSPAGESSVSDPVLPAFEVETPEEFDIVILLFAIAIACYFFVAKREFGDGY